MTEIMKTNYIIAVSGGVDSVALFHKLMNVKPPQVSYIVAHIDHGIREDSASDALFVRELAEKYGAQFETKRLELGAGASEDFAREARYKYLFEIMKKYKAEAIITAHHQDDVLETMILNILRGTGPRGLIGFTKKHILRPFINKTKQEILEYAKEQKLSWREDSTNTDQSYLRNDVRVRFMPKLHNRQQWLEIRNRVQEIYREIDDLTSKLLIITMNKGELVRARFVILPVIVQQELMASWFRYLELQFDRKMVERAVLGAKTLRSGKHLELSGKAKLYSLEKTIIIKVRI